MSPEKKKRKTTNELNPKRKQDSDEQRNKRSKSVGKTIDDLQVKKRKNFVTACEQVSFRAYTDYRARLLMLYLPRCLKTSVCIHQDSRNMNVKEILPIVEETFMIDIRTNMWLEALEVCVLCINPTQYLSPNVLKEVVEIMLNAHEDESAEEPVQYTINKCQHVFKQNFSFHPPCSKKLRKCYNDFLTSPMDLKDKTFTNRQEFESSKGIVKYCFNRLENEIHADSKDESLVDKYENIPEEMKQSVKGLHWQKEKFEIFEVLDRTERIDRLMAVLESIVELLQFDLAVWHGRYKQNLGNHIMRSHKPLMAFILWSNNVLYTGAVNHNCRQILKLFVYFVHLQYPEKYINIMTAWINIVIQTFYVCENNSNSDYPNTGKYCSTFAKEFYKIIGDLPNDSIIRILHRIKPNYMKHLLGTIHLTKILSTDKTCILSNLITFIKEERWTEYPVGHAIELNSKFYEPVNVKRVLRHLCKKLNEWECNMEVDERKVYPKFDPNIMDYGINSYHVVQALFITLDAYLNSHSIQNVQETLNTLNEQLTSGLNSYSLLELGSYSVTEQFIKKYRSLIQMLRELVLLLQEKKNYLPDSFSIFKKINLLDF